jgi:MFS family permease
LPSGLTKEEVRKSLKNSVLDGASYSSMLGLTQNYTTPYALAMNASTTQIGFLSGIPAIAMVLTQMVSPILVEKTGNRKGILLLAALFNTLMWLPILLIPYIFPSHQVWWLIAFITLLTAFDSIGNAPWNSMMADIVPVEVRGRYFASRSRINNLVALILSFVAGGVLQALTKNGFIGFSIIFAGAMVSRFFSFYFLSQMAYPSVVVPKTKQASIFKLATVLGSTNIGKYIIFNTLINLSASFSGPFFSVYMLRDLKFSYLTYVIINAVNVLAMLIFMPFWGKRIDKAGSIKVMKAASLFLPILPVLWLVSANVYYLCGVQVIGGFAWSGCVLALNLFLYYAAPVENRTRYIALSNALMFGGAALGSLLGGILASIVPAIMMHRLLTIFLISGVARFLVVIVFMPGISEVRQVPKTTYREILFGGVQFAGVKSFSSNILHGFSKHKNK